MTTTLANTRTISGQVKSDKGRIKGALAERDMTITDLAAELGLSRHAVSRAINHGLYRPTVRRIKAHLGLMS